MEGNQKIITLILIATLIKCSYVFANSATICGNQIYESDCSRQSHCKYYNVDNKDNGYCMDIRRSQCYLIEDPIDCGQVGTCFWHSSNGICANLKHSNGCRDFDNNFGMCGLFNSLCRFEGDKCYSITEYESQQVEKRKKIQEIRNGTSISKILKVYFVSLSLLLILLN